MNYASEILKNIFDDNAKAVIDTVDQALSDKVNDQMDEMKKGLIDSVYENDFSYMLEKKKEEDIDYDKDRKQHMANIRANRVNRDRKAGKQPSFGDMYGSSDPEHRAIADRIAPGPREDIDYDKDGDGDGDFADIMMTRMKKSGMSKKEALRKTRKHNK